MRCADQRRFLQTTRGFLTKDIGLMSHSLRNPLQGISHQLLGSAASLTSRVTFLWGFSGFFFPKWGCVFCFWPSGLFLFFSRFLAKWLGFFGVRVRVVSSVLVFGVGVAGRFWFLVGVGLGLGLCCLLRFLHLLLHRETALPGIRPQKRLPPFLPPIIVGLSGVTRLLPLDRPGLGLPAPL